LINLLYHDLREEKKTEIKLADIGCSVGLMAIEFAKKGYQSYGYDFDPAAITIANKLKIEEKINVEFFEHDVSNQEFDIPIDIAVCFDMFEHLHDDEIGVLLNNLKKSLTKNACVVFHTLPGEYDYIFWDNDKKIINFPLVLNLFKKCSVSSFAKSVKIYALIKDIINIIKYNLTQKESIKKSGHPNPLTENRLIDIFNRAGYEIIFIKTGFLSDLQFNLKNKEYFLKHNITHRSIFGVITPEDNKKQILECHLR
jgi:2-polyprenyl-3-methyl-5-hydroxy-6-metoxy-1,4-benzoquinol methylase